jgi:3-hydroxymyristoyl/3-hydroxydecanoyl-(acyl carrier protein) dehydratase
VRFLLYDRLTTVVPRERVEAVKHVSLTEEFLRGHHPRSARMPASLVLEAMVQALAGLVMASHDWRFVPFLMLVEDVALPPDLRPGVRLDLAGELHSTNPQGSVGRTSASVEGRVVASAARVVYGHFPAPDPAALRERFRALGVVP